MSMGNHIKGLVAQALESLRIKAGDFIIEHPADLAMGDYSTNVAIKYGYRKEIIEYLKENKPEDVESVELAGPGFINFYLSRKFFQKSLDEIIKRGKEFGRNESLRKEKIMVEHTDPNPFKEFHIGHLMPNVIGSAVARLFRWSGAEVKEVCYQGDVGLHVAKAVWGMLKGEKDPYPAGARAYEESENAKEEISSINKKLYDKSDPNLNKIYENGRRTSLRYFDSVYQRLGAKFDDFYFESEVVEAGRQLVQEYKGKVFEESDGAIVFRAEKYNPHLHTRVFINSLGLPTYEAKELGLAKMKFNRYPYTKSVIITGNEIDAYFRVLLEAMKLVLPDLASKTEHLSHGMLSLGTGKMSSRTGKVVKAEDLIEMVKTKTKGNEEIALGAIKYMILRQAIGRNIVFDLEKSVSVEGDSGVYLQYACARTNSLLEKAKAHGLKSDCSKSVFGDEEIYEVERFLYRFPEVVERATAEREPHHLATYLSNLAGSFNNLYAKEQIVSNDGGDPYRLAVAQAFNIVMRSGLSILGIPTPERM